MFGIDDPGIWSVYLLAIVCLVFSIYWGVSRWNKEYKSDEDSKSNSDININNKK